MKFRFCGDGDCPDWVLAEIHSTLSVLSSIKLRTLAQSVAKSIIGEDLPEERIKDIFVSSKCDPSAAKSAVSCLRYLLISAASHNVDENIFGAELQQLGLPKEHSSVLCRVLSEYLPKLREKLLESKLTVNELLDISYTIPTDAMHCGQFNIKIKDELVNGVPTNTSYKVNIHKSDIRLLLNELKTLRNIMENYDYEAKYA